MKVEVEACLRDVVVVVVVAVGFFLFGCHSGAYLYDDATLKAHLCAGKSLQHIPASRARFDVSRWGRWYAFRFHGCSIAKENNREHSLHIRLQLLCLSTSAAMVSVFSWHGGAQRHLSIKIDKRGRMVPGNMEL